MLNQKEARLIALMGSTSRPKILVTTPDYFPKLGGLTTFTHNLVSALESLASVQIFHWKTVGDLTRFKPIARYDLVIHVHFQAGYLIKTLKSVPRINFFHGSEILFYSSNPIKMLIKKFFKRNICTYFENSLFNIAVSQFTLDQVANVGLRINYARDLVLHNVIDTKHAVFVKKNIHDETLLFSIIARDVKHKNIDGALEFAQQFCLARGTKGKVYVTSTRVFKNYSQLEIINCDKISNQERDEILKKVHLNLLMSLDDRKHGFYEGFGLSVLEAGIFGTPTIASTTGGLLESVHDGVTGWHYDQTNLQEIVGSVVNNYQQVSQTVFEHTNDSHGLKQLEKFFAKILGKI